MFFFYYPSAQTIWTQSALAPVQLDGSFTTSWLSYYVERETKECCQAVIILWSIWNNRNTFVWGKKPSPDALVVSQGFSFLHQWQYQRSLTKQHTDPYSNLSRSVESAWTTPPVGRLKCNMDVALRQNCSTGSFGALIRNSD